MTVEPALIYPNLVNFTNYEQTNYTRSQGVVYSGGPRLEVSESERTQRLANLSDEEAILQRTERLLSAADEEVRKGE